LLIPDLNLDAPIRPVWLQRIESGGQVYSQWRVPAGRTVGWHNTSARLGESGNLVLNGHHNSEGHVFKDLIKIQVGAQIRLEGADGEGLNYTVVQTLLLQEAGRSLEERQANARWLLPSHDERITLVTCWPPDGNSHRFIVLALPTDKLEQSP
jgi:sortase A